MNCRALFTTLAVLSSMTTTTLTFALPLGPEQTQAITQFFPPAPAQSEIVDPASTAFGFFGDGGVGGGDFGSGFARARARAIAEAEDGRIPDGFSPPPPTSTTNAGDKRTPEIARPHQTSQPTEPWQDIKPLPVIEWIPIDDQPNPSATDQWQDVAPSPTLGWIPIDGGVPAAGGGVGGAPASGGDGNEGWDTAWNGDDGSGEDGGWNGDGGDGNEWGWKRAAAVAIAKAEPNQ
ncbi:hypothetical protein IAU59_006739 [Kwoniella sp. CBS 9459]